jgi:hypothetical protein
MTFLRTVLGIVIFRDKVRSKITNWKSGTRYETIPNKMVEICGTNFPKTLTVAGKLLYANRNT